MKSLFTFTILALSICLNAQGDILELTHTVNSQLDRNTDYSMIVTLTYGQSFEENAAIDTTVVDSDGNNSELTLMTKKVDVFGAESDVRYDIDMLTGDTTMITTTTYNKQGKVVEQFQDYGDGAAAMFNAHKFFTYDDQGRVLNLTSKMGNEGEESGGTFAYNEDGLPQSVSMSMGMGKFNVVREDLDGYIKYAMKGEMSPEMIEMIEMMGKSVDDMPQEYFELREKDGLYEMRHMKEVGEEKTITLQSTTTRDKEGNVHQLIMYDGSEISIHKKYTYADGKLITISDPIEETNYTIDYDKNGNPLTEYENYSKSMMTYNKDNILASKASSSIFSNAINELEVVKYYK